MRVIRHCSQNAFASCGRHIHAAAVAAIGIGGPNPPAHFSDAPLLKFDLVAGLNQCKQLIRRRPGLQADAAHRTPLLLGLAGIKAGPCGFIVKICDFPDEILKPVLPVAKSTQTRANNVMFATLFVVNITCKFIHLRVIP